MTSPLDQKIAVTIFKNLGAKSKAGHQWSLRELLDEIVQTEAAEKKDLPLLKLATFGQNKTDKGSVRHDANMITVSGVEGDYDAERITPQEAARRFRKAKVACVIYTSASHTPEKPRWRVLVPFSDELLPEQRNQMLARVNGLVDGTLSHESFTLSQAFYFGDAVGKYPADCYEVDGDYLDLRDDLDDGAFLPELVKAKTTGEGRRESTELDEAQMLFDRDLESGKLQEALEAALEYRWDMGDKIGSDEDRELWWRNICWAIHHGSGGDKTGYQIWSDYASRSYRASRLKARGDSVKRAIATEWHYAKDDRAAGVLGFGTVYKQLEDGGWVYGAIQVDDFDDDEDEEPTHLPKKKAEPAQKGETPEPSVPKSLLTIPGVLGHAVDHYNATSTRYQPQYAVQTALALGSVVLGRNWMSETNNYTSLYLVNLGATGRGKEFGRTYIENVLEEANLGFLIGPLKYQSEAGLMGYLTHTPRHVTVYDEFGRLLSSTGSSGNTNLRDAQTLLMSLFGQLGGIARGAAYSTNGKTAQQIEQMRNTKIVRPAVTILGLSTPETFFDALSQDDVANGFLNRLLVVNSTQPRRREVPRAWKKAPRELLSWVRHYSGVDPDSFSDNPESSGEAPEPEVVMYTAKAMKMLDDIEDEVIEKQNALDLMRLDGMWSRSREITMRIALIVALSRDKSKIDEVSLGWAWNYVKHYTEEMVGHVQVHMGSSPNIRIAEQLATVIEASAEKGISIGELPRKSHQFSKLEKRDSEEVIYRLLTRHRIVQSRTTSGKKGGKPTMKYFHINYAPRDVGDSKE